jgi:hypothetical protein
MCFVAIKMGRLQGSTRMLRVSLQAGSLCYFEVVFLSGRRRTQPTGMIQIWALHRQSGSDCLEYQLTGRKIICYLGNRTLIDG